MTDAYTEERVPVGRQIVERANQSIGETGRIFQALGLLSTEDPEQTQADMAARKLPGGAQEKQRELLREAIAVKDYEFYTHGVELDQRYRSAAATATALGIELTAVTVGPGTDYEDLYGDWARLREVGDTGCVLLRPDNYVAYRSTGLPEDPAAALGSAIRQILAR